MVLGHGASIGTLVINEYYHMSGFTLISSNVARTHNPIKQQTDLVWAISLYPSHTTTCDHFTRQEKGDGKEVANGRKMVAKRQQSDPQLSLKYLRPF